MTVLIEKARDFHTRNDPGTPNDHGNQDNYNIPLEGMTITADYTRETAASRGGRRGHVPFPAGQ